MKMTARWALLVMGMAAAMLSLAALGGCRLGGSVSTETALNALRRENADLKDKVAKAEGEAAELRAKLETTGGTRAALPPTLPVCTQIEIGGLSGWSKDGQSLELLVQTLDGRRRFVPVAASIKVTSEGSPFASLRFSPDQVRELYRSGVMGTYYLVSVPRLQVGEVVTVEVLDEVTGQTHKAEWKQEPTSNQQN
jgi:hypothetical protein